MSFVRERCDDRVKWAICIKLALLLSISTYRDTYLSVHNTELYEVFHAFRIFLRREKARERKSW